MVPRILIVDDERDFVELMQFRLASLGYEFIVANDGVQALSQARQFKPNLILLDILLPDLDGLSVFLFAARAGKSRRRPPIS
jgi:CheY-like chemotaxis protein